MITRKNILAIIEALDSIFKRTAAYTNRKFEGAKIVFSYRFLIADDKLVLYFDESNNGMAGGMEARDFFRNKVIENSPSRINLSPEISLSVFIVPSKIPANNDNLFDILVNCKKILIPTSSGHGLNIVDDDRNNNPLYEIAEFSRRNYVWFWRNEFGPNNCNAPEDDCNILEYIVRVFEYL